MIEFPAVNWRKECTEKVGAIQTVATAALSFIWFIRDIPHIVSLLPTDSDFVKTVFPAADWISTALKPYETIVNTTKQVGTIFAETPDRFLAARPEEMKK